MHLSVYIITESNPSFIDYFYSMNFLYVNNDEIKKKKQKNKLKTKNQTRNAK